MQFSRVGFCLENNYFASNLNSPDLMFGSDFHQKLSWIALLLFSYWLSLARFLKFLAFLD